MLPCVNGLPCSNGGRCTANGTCICTEGVSGLLCEIFQAVAKKSVKDDKSFYGYVVGVTGSVLFVMVVVSALVRVHMNKKEMEEKRRKHMLGYDDSTNSEDKGDDDEVKGHPDDPMARLEWQRKLGRMQNARESVDIWYKLHKVGLDKSNTHIAVISSPFT